MAGLLQRGMQSQQPQPPQRGAQAPQQGQPPQQGQGGERAQFKPLVDRMLNYVYGEGLPKIERVLQSGNPVESMGQVIGMTMSSVYNVLNEGGKTVSPNVMVRAGMELSKAIGELAMEMGVLQKGEDDAIEMAFMVGLGQLGKTANGMPPEEKQRYAEIARGLKEGKRAAQGAKQQGQSQPPPQQQRPPQRQQQPPQQQPMQGGR